MTRLARLSLTLSFVALGLCLGLVPMTDGPVLTVAFVAASITTAVLLAMVIDTVRPMRRLKGR